MTDGKAPNPSLASGGWTRATTRGAIVNRFAKIADGGWRVAGVNLYVVARPATILETAPAHPQFWASPRGLGDRTLYQVTEPAIPDPQTPIKPDGSRDPGHIHLPEHPLHELPTLLGQMYNWMYQTQPGLASGGIQYIIVHIRELRAPEKKRARAVSQTDWEEERVARVVKVYMRGALDMFDGAPIGSPRGYYDHYDPHTRLTGHLAFGRYAAVLGGLSDATLRTFVPLLQSGEMADTGGLTLATFTPTLSLIAQWSGTEDVAQIRDQVRELQRGGDAATNGQIWISWALAVIGVALAFIAFLKEPLYLLPGLLLLGLSSFPFAAHARSAKPIWLSIGLGLFVAGIVACALGLALDLYPLYSPYLPNVSPLLQPNHR